MSPTFRRVRAAVMGTLWVLVAAVAAAQDTPPPAPSAGPTVAVEPAAAQMGAMLGGAEFMLISERPYDAEKLFKAVLAQDSTNAHAKDGLRRVALGKRPMWTVLGHGYNNNLDASLVTYGGGPAFFTPHGKATFWVGDGFFKNNINGDNPKNPLSFLASRLGTSDDAALRKLTVNATFEPNYKQFDGYIYLNRTFYPEAPDRTLWNLKGTWQRQRGREYYSVFAGQHDSYLQTDLVQYFAPDSYTAVKNKVLTREVGAGGQIPFGRFDFIPSYSYFDYTDGNSRRVGRAQLMYRALPKGGSQMPILRLGATYVSDSGDKPSLQYYLPIGFKSVSISGDYVMVTGKYRYGVFGSWPLTGDSGEQFGRYYPSRTLFSFVNYNVTPSHEFWVKFIGVHSGGLSPKLSDVVVGMNMRF